MDRSSPVRSWTSGRIRTVYGSTSAGQGNRPTTLSLRPSTGPCGPNVWTHIGSRRSQKRRRESKLGGRNIMRVVLTGPWGRGRRANSPMKSRLAATSLGHKQPKTHPRLGIKNRVRSYPGELTSQLVQFSGGRSRPPLVVHVIWSMPLIQGVALAVLLAHEMSVFQTGHGKGSCRRRHELLRCDRPGVEDESAGSDLARDGQEDHLVASGRDPRDQRPADAAVEASL